MERNLIHESVRYDGTKKPKQWIFLYSNGDVEIVSAARVRK